MKVIGEGNKKKRNQKTCLTPQGGEFRKGQGTQYSFLCKELKSIQQEGWGKLKAITTEGTTSFAGSYGKNREDEPIRKSKTGAWEGALPLKADEAEVDLQSKGD